jgi:hypothetical protein
MLPSGAGIAEERRGSRERRAYTSECYSDIELREKTRAYLAAGAEEVWLVTEDGSIHYFDAAGEKAASRYPVTLSLPGPIS